MVLSVLLDSDDPNLAPRCVATCNSSRARCPACRVAEPGTLRIALVCSCVTTNTPPGRGSIQPWLNRRFGLGSADAYHQMMERAQRALFLDIIREPGGKRAMLSQAREQSFKTFPQYAMERMEGREPTPIERTVHCFGFTQICELHARTIAWLGRWFDVRVYHLNVLSAWLQPDADFTQMTQNLHARLDADPAGLTRVWGKAGGEALGLLKPLGTSDAFTIEHVLPAQAKRAADSVLTRLPRLVARHSDALDALVAGHVGADRRLSGRHARGRDGLQQHPAPI